MANTNFIIQSTFYQSNDLLECRDLAIFHIPGAYLLADIPEDKVFVMNFSGQFAYIIYQVDPSHKRNIVFENDKQKCCMCK